MKKMIYLAGTCIVLLLTSCSNDDSPAAQAGDGTIMKFASNRSAEAKAMEIAAFRQEQEGRIMEKILLRNNVAAPTEASVADIQPSSATASEDAIRADLQFYHRERLKAIYEERAHYNFTSIQSIADEINSLKLLDPAKSEALFERHSKFLDRNELLTTPVFGDMASNIANPSGQFIVDGKLLQAPKRKALSTTAGASAERMTAVSGLAATNGSTLYVYHNAFEEYSSPGRTKFVAAYASFVINYGQTFQYPCYYFSAYNSIAYFGNGFPPPYMTLQATVYFPSGYGSIIATHSTQTFDEPETHYTHGIASGTFSFIIGGQTFNISGTHNF